MPPGHPFPLVASTESLIAAAKRSGSSSQTKFPLGVVLIFVRIPAAGLVYSVLGLFFLQIFGSEDR